MFQKTHTTSCFQSGPPSRWCIPVSERKGFTLTEMAGTCLLMVLVFTTTIPMLQVVAHERRSTEQRQFALQHAANLLERTTQQEWSKLTPGAVALQDAEEELRLILPGLEQQVSVHEVAGEAQARQIVASVRWKNKTGEYVQPLKLSTWRYQIDEVR